MTGQDNEKQYSDFIRNEKRRSNIMTKNRIQPFCRAKNFNFGCFDGTRDFSRSVTERKIALLLYNNHFCLIRKSENVSFKQTIKELKDTFKIVDNYLTKENVNSRFKYEFLSKKIDSYSNSFIVYDLETRNTERARPSCISLYRLSKLAGRYNGDLSQYEIDECKNDTTAFDGDDCFS